MKKLFTLVFLCVSLSAFSQPKYTGRFVGDGAGITNIPLSGINANLVTNNGAATYGRPFVGDGAGGEFTTNGLTGVNFTNATGTVSAQTVIASTNWIGSDGKMSTFGGVMNFNQGASGAFNLGQTGLGSQDGHVTSGDFTATLNPGFIGSAKFTSTTTTTGIVTNLFLIGATNAPLVAYGGDGHVGPTNSLETLTNVIVTGKAGNKVYLGGNFSGATNLLEFGSGSTMTANIGTNGTVYAANVVSPGTVSGVTVAATTFNQGGGQTVLAAGTASFFSYVTFSERIQAKTSNTTLTSADRHSIFVNTGAAGAVTNTLPAAATGIGYVMAITVAQQFAFKAAGSDVIQYGGNVSGAAGTISANTIGMTVEIVCVKTGLWMVMNAQAITTAGAISTDWVISP